MSDELVTVAEFETVFEAQMAKDCLEDNDIKATVVGENLVSLMVPVPLIAVEVKVLAENAERAKAVLESHQTECKNIDDDDMNDEQNGCNCDCDSGSDCGSDCDCPSDAGEDA